jgi:hypothetical protein
MAGQSMDRQHPHRAGRPEAVHMEIGGHASMMPAHRRPQVRALAVAAAAD